VSVCGRSSLPPPYIQCTARSPPARPLKRIEHPSTHALEILPRHPRLANDKRSPALQHSDSFRLTISAFDQKFHLHLRPNDHLIHPAARINYYTAGPNGQSILTHTEPLLRESVKAYWGEVVPIHMSSSRMREDVAGVINRPAADLGWARIMVHNQGDVDEGIAPIFEGAFSVNGIVHHISTKDNYLRTKHPLDPPLDQPDTSLVIWRDIDVVNAHEEDTLHHRVGLDTDLRPPTPQTCGHDSLPYNTDPLWNPLLQKTPLTPWLDPLDFILGPFNDVAKRDDVAGSGASTK
jgi:hypothetical protein